MATPNLTLVPAITAHSLGDHLPSKLVPEVLGYCEDDGSDIYLSVESIMNEIVASNPSTYLLDDQNFFPTEIFQKIAAWQELDYYVHALDFDHDNLISETEFLSAYAYPLETGSQGVACLDHDAYNAFLSNTQTSAVPAFSVWKAQGEAIQHLLGYSLAETIAIMEECIAPQAPLIIASTAERKTTPDTPLSVPEPRRVVDVNQIINGLPEKIFTPKDKVYLRSIYWDDKVLQKIQELKFEDTANYAVEFNAIAKAHSSNLRLKYSDEKGEYILITLFTFNSALPDMIDSEIP